MAPTVAMVDVSPTSTGAASRPSSAGGASPKGSEKSRGSRSPTSPSRNRSESLSKVMAKLQQQKLLAEQRASEVNIAEEFNELFKHRDMLRNAKALERFWSEVKARLIKRHGTIPQAFKVLDTSGDGSIGFLEFNDMLRNINFSMDQRVMRSLFDKASCGDRELSMEELKTLLMEKTIRKLRFVMEGFNNKQDRVQSHIHRFIRLLAQTGETNRVRAVDRFQRKMKAPFCKEIWQACLKPLKVGVLTIDKRTFVDVVTSFVTREAGMRLLAYEVHFMQRIFDRVDHRGRGKVLVRDFATTLLQLGPDPDKLPKAATAFDFFDSDGDGCLLYEEIMDLCSCCCAQRPMVEENLRHVHGPEFEEELLAQEGRRAYEFALWHLQRTEKVEGGIVTKREWVEVLENLPDLLDRLMPGRVRMHWVLEPSAPEGPDPPSPTWPPTKQDLPSPTPASVASFVGGGRAPPSLQHLGGGRFGGGGLPGWSGDEAVRAAKFRQMQTQRFKQTLGDLGAERLAELVAGFAAPPEPTGADDASAAAESAASGGAAAPGGAAALRAGRGQGLGRSASAPMLAVASPSSRVSLGSPASSLGGRSPGGRSVGTPAGARTPNKRRSTPESTRSAQARKATIGQGTKRGGSPRAGGSPRIRSPAGTSRGAHGLGSGLGEESYEVPLVPAEKWGAESADRFRLFAAVTIASGRHQMDRPDPGAPLKHKCYVCLRTHHFTMDCGRA